MHIKRSIYNKNHKRKYYKRKKKKKTLDYKYSNSIISNIFILLMWKQEILDLIDFL